MSTPQSVRLGPDLQRRLAAYAATQPGMSISGAIGVLVDEGLRMREHPGIVFRDGPLGRRAGLAAGPDVWEVIRAMKQVKAARVATTAKARLDVVATNTGLTLDQVRDAVGYWSAYPDEVDLLIEASDQAEDEALAAWERRQGLLA